MLHHVSNTLLGYCSSTFQVRVFGRKKGKKKQLKQPKAVRMDLYQIEGSNWDRKSGHSTFPVSLETADTSPPARPWEVTKEVADSVCLWVTESPPGHLAGHLAYGTGNYFWGSVCAIPSHIYCRGCACAAPGPNLKPRSRKEGRWFRWWCRS